MVRTGPPLLAACARRGLGPDPSIQITVPPSALKVGSPRTPGSRCDARVARSSTLTPARAGRGSLTVASYRLTPSRSGPILGRVDS